MITMTFNAPTKFARKIQDLVKQYDGRFVNNPLTWGNYTRFEISFNNSENSKKFSVRTYILNQPYT